MNKIFNYQTFKYQPENWVLKYISSKWGRDGFLAFTSYWSSFNEVEKKLVSCKNLYYELTKLSQKLEDPKFKSYFDINQLEYRVQILESGDYKITIYPFKKKSKGIRYRLVHRVDLPSGKEDKELIYFTSLYQCLNTYYKNIELFKQTEKYIKDTIVK